MELDANEVDIGHVVKCGKCKRLTYYPFERPWYRRRKLIIGYFLSLLVSFALGLLGNYIYDRYMKAESATSMPQSERKA